MNFGCFSESFPTATTSLHPHICSLRASPALIPNLNTEHTFITGNRTPAYDIPKPPDLANRGKRIKQRHPTIAEATRLWPAFPTWMSCGDWGIVDALKRTVSTWFSVWTWY